MINRLNGADLLQFLPHILDVNCLNNAFQTTHGGFKPGNIRAAKGQLLVHLTALGNFITQAVRDSSWLFPHT